MPIDSRTLPAGTTDDATFREWGSGISASLAAVGLVKTSDSGQINWATAIKPTTASTFAGYEIWRFADSDQASFPVFIRVEYGVGNSVAGQPRPLVVARAGYATDGAGNLTNMTTVPAVVSTGGTAPSGTRVSRTAAGPGWVAHMDSIDGNWIQGSYFSIQRPRRASGETFNDFIVQMNTPNAGTGTSGRFALVPRTTHIAPVEFSGIHPSYGIVGNAVGASGADFQPYAVFWGEILFMLELGYASVAASELTPIQVEHLGQTRTMLPMGDYMPTGRASSGYTVYTMMPWDT